MTAPDVDALRAEIADFHATLTETLDKQDAKLALMKRQQAAAERSSRRHRLALIIAGVGLAVDLALSGLFYYQHTVQTCQNDHAAKLFHAEFAKVSGQIMGLTEVKDGQVDLGLNQFVAASQHYLDQIAQLNQDHC